VSHGQTDTGTTVDTLLRDLARAERIDMEVIQRTLALYQYAHRKAVEQEHKLSITDDQDTIIKNIVFR